MLLAAFDSCFSTAFWIYFSHTMQRSGQSLPNRALPFHVVLAFVVIGVSPPSLRSQHTFSTTQHTHPIVPLRSALGDSTYLLPLDTPSSKSNADSILVVDTTRMSTPVLVGTYDRSLDSTKFITKDDLHFLDYLYLGGVLQTMPGIFIRDQFSEGQYNQLTMRGSDWRAVAITANGRLLNDPASGIYNLYHFTTEYADRIEVITGPRAFLYGLNSTGGAVNLVTKNYNSNRPFSKINYTESAYNYQYSDGTFSQNISRKVNFTFGFQHQGTDGRFPASTHDAWNMRIKVRYNLSRDLNIILSEYLTHTETDLNGGVDPVKTGIPTLAFDRIQAVIRNYDSFEKLNRHDLDLSLVGTVLGDTTNISALSFYYSNAFREYRDGQARRNYPSNTIIINSDHRSSWMGVMFTQDYHNDQQRLNVGATIEVRQIEGSPNLGRRRNSIGSVWAKQEFLLGSFLTIAGFGRYDRYLGESAIGVGGDATLKLGNLLTLFGGASTSKRFPTYQELFWRDSTVNRIEPIVSETHRSVELGARLHLASSFDLHLAYFHRTVEHPIETRAYGRGFVFPGIEFANGTTLFTNGIEAHLSARVWVLTVEGTGMFLTQKNASGILSRYPRYSANGGIFYWQRLLDDRLELKVGFMGRYVSSSQGEEFNPEVPAYVTGSGAPIGYGSSVDGLLIAAIGSAYIHFLWENLTNARYYITPYYPVLDRAITFGISWQFLD